MKKQGIYILTNPAFPQYVKIGYSDDIQERCRQLFNTSVPFPFRVHAIYETDNRLTDKELHRLIDQLDEDLRVTKNREFYEMDAGEAYDILLSIATISGTKDKLTLMTLTDEEKEAEKQAVQNGSRLQYSIENAQDEIRNLYLALCKHCSSLPGAICTDTSQYHSCKINGKLFAAIGIQKKKVTIGLYIDKNSCDMTLDNIRDISGFNNFGNAEIEYTVFDEMSKDAAIDLINNSFEFNK